MLNVKSATPAMLSVKALLPRGKSLAALACLSFGLSAPLFAQDSVQALAYDEMTSGPVPIPAAERGLQTVKAEPWFKVSDEGWILEGPNFDANGDLIFSDVSNKRVLRLTKDKQLSTFVQLDDLSPGGLAFRQDGRLFIAALDFINGVGAIYSVDENGGDLQTVIPAEAGYQPDDLTFDAEGGLYFTDFAGESTQADGAVYYMPPDLSEIIPVVPDLAKANGIALSPDGQVLWTTEFGRNVMHRIQLADPTTIAPIGSAIPYHFIGPAPDSMRVDTDGNVYVSIFGQGRLMAFNSNGIPIGQILLPGRETGHNLMSTSMAIKPGTNDLYAVTSDGEGGEGANIFHAKVFASGLPSPASN
ncbi:gluconolactonase [Marinobacterium mangrovicola]|uniref:Gluconolactonase n=1 Tax=Marinobacterium mangrovicola TaxID=1476959 RepID=A0A4R1GBT1_9GAMM|nr:gluconolactonase [Marinobacterium mangrovicola]